MKDLFKKWKRQKLVEQGLLSLGLGLPLSSLVLLFLNISTSFYLAIALFFSLFILVCLLLKTDYFSVGLPDLAHYLNQKYPELEQSTDLLLQQESALNGIALLQKEKTEQQLNSLNISFPNRLPLALLALGVGGLASWGINQISPILSPNNDWNSIGQVTSLNLPAVDTTLIPASPKLLKAKVKIQPPAYTGMATKTTKELDFEAPYWSTIFWDLTFDQTLSDAELIFGDGKAISLQKGKEGRYRANLQLKKSIFYQVKYRNSQSDWQLSDYFQIKIIEDHPPEITVQGLPAYAEYVFNPDKTVSFAVSVKDDYGIDNAWIIATLSKGEGESVKFRDDTLYFEPSFSTHLKQYDLNKTLRLGDLNMESGDELYLHIEARDQRTPSPQTSKTYKYILAFENPDKMQVDMAGGLAVNRMPEYFRSQRQIIIDTEKLIADRSKLRLNVLNEKSNNIAIDQKLLRLRYGRFLGEEFETVIGANAVAEESHDHDHDHEGHDHDHDHEHNQASQQSEDQYLAEGHEHEQNWGGPNEDEEIKELEPYVHAHDITEEATYFDATTTAKLRVALSAMWDAELHLRMGNPEKALPYEYRALKLIKEIQQASRIYVERIGFDPPVIKVAEKRLTGELNKIRSSALKQDKKAPIDYPAIRAALPLLEQLKESTKSITLLQEKQLEAAGDELAGLALEQPGGFLISLQKLRNILDKQVDLKTQVAYLDDLQKVFWDVLADNRQPVQQAGRASELQELFLQELSK